jgi:hypothetical protein
VSSKLTFKEISVPESEVERIFVVKPAEEKTILKVPFGKLLTEYFPSVSEIISLCISGIDMITLAKGLFSLSEIVPLILFWADDNDENQNNKIVNNNRCI